MKLERDYSEEMEWGLIRDRFRWYLVSIADRCHGDDGVPEAIGYGLEIWGRIVQLEEVDGGREEDDADDEEEDEQTELLGGRLQSVSQNFEALKVSRQLEDPEHAD